MDRAAEGHRAKCGTYNLPLDPDRDELAWLVDWNGKLLKTVTHPFAQYVRHGVRGRLVCGWRANAYQQYENERVKDGNTKKKKKKKKKTVLNSFDVMGGSHTFTAVWAPAKFRDGNPALYKALVAALKEATDIVNKDKKAAAALWIEDSKSKLSLDMVGKIVTGPQVRWTMTPENTMKYADFMAEVGTLKAKPESWKDYFFPEIHDERGS